MEMTTSRLVLREMTEDDFDALYAILSDPEMMGQIMGLARSLGGGAQSDPTSESSSPDGGMPGPGATDPLSLLSSIDPKFLDLAIGMMNTYRSGDDRRAALLTALRPFVRTVAEDIGNRCGKCYEMRLFETARQAKEGGFDSFTSSLFISPYQNHELMRQTAERASAEYGVEFLYRDFRPYFKAGQEKARELDFYMQKYCGCVFSEEERYLKATKIIP